MKKYLLRISLSLLVSISSFAKNPNDGWKYSLHLGYSVGGTMPAGMPAEMRSLDSYRLCPNLQFGCYLNKRIISNWGFMTGLDFESKGMNIDARVKNYHIKMVHGGEEIEGQFTGSNHTEENQLALTLPVAITFNVKRVNIYAGIYGSYILGSTFKGYAYDGYLRRRDPGMVKGDPTGTKIELGTSASERGDYDFSSDMRRWQIGVLAGVDWNFSGKWGAYANVNYGFSGIHDGSFNVLDQALHPIFGTIGLTYRLNKQ